jgi:predicted metal-dependent phosphotriesterase family hydrolase
MIDQFAPNWRMTHIPQDVVPMLRGYGVSDAAIMQMTVGNRAACST